MKTPTAYHLPDQIWIARWDGQANTSTTYISNAGWQPGGRMKQYVGGHDERYGGVTINIDRDYLSLGTPKAPVESHCGGVPVDFADYPRVTDASDPALVKALQCLLTEQKAYGGRLSGQARHRHGRLDERLAEGARPPRRCRSGTVAPG